MTLRPAAFLRFLSLVAVLFSCCTFAWSNNRHESSETVQKLVLNLQGENKNDQIRAAQALGEMGSSADGAVPALVRIIKTGSPEVRIVSSIALLKIDSNMKDMIPILLQALDKEGQEQQEEVLSKGLGLQDDALRKWSSLMRSKVDPKIIPLLVQALGENDKDIRILGVLVLGGISTHVPEALPYVFRAYKDRDKEVRGVVLGALARIGPGTKGVVPVVLGGLKDPEPEVRIRAVAALGRMGPEVAESVPALTEVLEDKEPQVRVAALKVLGLFGLTARTATQKIASRVNQANPQERLAAVAALLQIDPSRAGEGVPLLGSLLKDRGLELSVRLRAADLLERTGPPAEKEIVSSVELLSDPKGEIRKSVAHLLSQVGPAAAPALTRALQDKRLIVRTGAIQALMEMRPIPPELIPSLETALQDKEPAVRYLAAEGLGDLGVLAQQAVPALVQALKDPEEGVRASVGNALLRMGPPALSAIAQAAQAEGQDPLLKIRARTLLRRMRHESS